MITSEERETAFREELKQLLDYYGADLFLMDIGKEGGWYPEDAIHVWMPTRYDEEGNVEADSCEFRL